MEEQLDLSEVVRHVIESLYDAIGEGEIRYSRQVSDYLQVFEMEDCIDSISQNLSPHTLDFLSGIKNEFQDLEYSSLTALQMETHVSNQCVYAGIVRNVSGSCRMYVGSAYGMKGIANRIFKEHLSPTIRKREEKKPFYLAMEMPGSVTNFIRLVNFPDPAPPGLVILAEAFCCSLFGTYDHRLYNMARPKVLPAVDFSKGLNRSDPLLFFALAPKTMGTDSTTYSRLRRLENCLLAGPMRACRYPGRSSWNINLFTLTFALPAPIGRAWNLKDSDIVNVQWDALPYRHPMPFAPTASDKDPGKGVGIRVFKTIEGVLYQHWIQRTLGPEQKMVAIANTLYDFLNEKIVEKNYDWDADDGYKKYYFFGVGKSSDKSPETLRVPAKRGRLKISYSKEFVWNNGTRQPETKPLALQKKDEQDADDMSNYLEGGSGSEDEVGVEGEALSDLRLEGLVRDLDGNEGMSDFDSDSERDLSNYGSDSENDLDCNEDEDPDELNWRKQSAKTRAKRIQILERERDIRLYEEEVEEVARESLLWSYDDDTWKEMMLPENKDTTEKAIELLFQSHLP